MQTQATTATFTIYNERDFSEFLLENSFFSKNYFDPTEFKTNLQNTVKKLEFNRENKEDHQDSFYQDNKFFWLFVSTGEYANKEINAVALIALPTDGSLKGELVYLDAPDNTDAEVLVEASRISASIAGHEPLDIDASTVGTWKAELNEKFQEKLNA